MTYMNPRITTYRGEMLNIGTTKHNRHKKSRKRTFICTLTADNWDMQYRAYRKYFKMMFCILCIYRVYITIIHVYMTIFCIFILLSLCLYHIITTYV